MLHKPAAATLTPLWKEMTPEVQENLEDIFPWVRYEVVLKRAAEI
jgi:hypothetical protein